MRALLLGLSTVLLIALASSGCRTRPWRVGWIEHEPTPDMPVPPDMLSEETTCRQIRSNKVDVLFVIDNSRSMDPMQVELRNRMPQFLEVFNQLAARGTAVDLHLGVITSDYGAGATGGLGCDPSPGGQRGLLQAVGAAANGTCKPPVGANYVTYQFGPNGQNNLPPGQNLNATFACMASVGAEGCGSEHQLESTYAALHAPENKGFVRDDALLVVVFLTNEDDCSAPQDSDLFDPDNSSRYGFPGSFLCTRWGVVCGDPPQLAPYGSSGGPLRNCQPAPNPNGQGPGRLFDVSRYVDFFSRPRDLGGVKIDPSQLLLVGIDAPSEPFEVILTDPNDARDGRDYRKCMPLNDLRPPWCVPTLQVSCHSQTSREFFADPAVRLNYVINRAANHAILPICDNDYSGALVAIANLAISKLSECCLGRALLDPDHPHCEVYDVIPGPTGDTEIPIPDCAGHPGRFPCWRLAERKACQSGEVGTGQSLGVVVDRNGRDPPPESTVRAACNVN